MRFSDIGWTDVTATTGLASHLVRLLGYEPEVTVLSVPVTYASMKNRDIDVFLGNWMPAMAADLRPYQTEGSVEVVGANLNGAKYTLAVPVPIRGRPAGFRRHPALRGAAQDEIYGIEPGNDGNRLVLTMIKKDEFGLGNFKLVESSEQGMLAEVERAVTAKRPIVFFGWEPHPMNMRFDMRYLSGGDTSFGPNYGGATVYTNVRAGYLEQCPNVGRLLRNLQVHAARRERDDGRHPRAQARARSRRRRVVEVESRSARGLVRRRHGLRWRARAAHGRGAAAGAAAGAASRPG